MGFAPGRHRCELDPMLDDPELLLCRSLRLTEKLGSPGIEALADLGLLKARREMAAAAPLGIEPRSALQTFQIGRAHVCTPVTNAHLVCRLLLEKNKEDQFCIVTFSTIIQTD